MNARQKMKKLKRDNELMHKIISNSPEMEYLYKRYNEPLKNVVCTTIPFKEFHCRRYLPVDIGTHSYYIEIYKQSLADELLSEVKNYIHYNTDWIMDEYPCIEASIFIGEKV